VDIKEYIESGILEAYILGALPNEERLQVEADIARYPELAAEAAAIEDGMRLFAESTPVQPPAHLQEQIWNAIASNAPTVDVINAPTVDKDNTPTVDKAEPSKVVPFPAPAKKQYGWQMAAAVAALVGSVLLNVILWSQRSKMQENQVALQQQLDTVLEKQRSLASLLDERKKENEMMADSSMQMIVMKSIQPGHPMAATIYWNKAKGETYLTMKKLPMPPQGMQYQMWVIQDGKPVSMGVIDNNMVENEVVARLPMEVTNGQAFAISLEKEGGSPTPTAENIYVLGKAS
jgi:anti-sigma-K factor RskA